MLRNLKDGPDNSLFSGNSPGGGPRPGTALAASVPALDKNHLRRISRIDPGRPALAMVAPVRHQGASFAAAPI
jgi:hypothetical protein